MTAEPETPELAPVVMPPRPSIKVSEKTLEHVYTAVFTAPLPVTASEVATELGMGRSTADTALRHLLVDGRVHRRMSDRTETRVGSPTTYLWSTETPVPARPLPLDEPERPTLSIAQPAEPLPTPEPLNEAQEPPEAREEPTVAEPEVAPEPEPEIFEPEVTTQVATATAAVASSTLLQTLGFQVESLVLRDETGDRWEMRRL